MELVIIALIAVEVVIVSITHRTLFGQVTHPLSC